MNQTYKPHISPAKKQEVEDIKKLFKEYPVVGLINLEGLPTLMLQRIRYGLGSDLVLKPTKKRFIKFAIDDLKSTHKNIEQLKEKMQGIPALMFTKDDPFLIYKKIEKNKASSAAKPGQKAPKDLGVDAGETPFAPGPMIGELGMLGLKTEVKNGKIHLKEGKVLVKTGEVISDKVASLLAKLGIEPMKIGLNVLLTYKDGEILEKSVLAVDEEEYKNNIMLAHSTSFALAVHLGIMNEATAKALLTKAQRESMAIADKVKTSAQDSLGTTAEPSTEAVVQEPPKEIEAKQEIHHQKHEKPAEIKEASANNFMHETASLAHKIIGSGVKEEPKGTIETAKKPELDINKLINTLKDRKSGEIS